MKNLSIKNNLNVEKSIIVNNHSKFKSTIETASGTVIGNLNLGSGYIYDNNGIIIYNIETI